MSDLLPNGAPIDAIPEALRRRAQWVLWREEPKKNKPDELTKMPYTDVRRKARANDPKTWIPFEEAVRRWAENPNGWAGIGYEFSEDDPYTGIDLDNCVDPATGIVEPWADRELAELLPTYAEISPSGRGIKLWAEAERAHTLGSGDKDAGQIEVYSDGRFFAVTGWVFEDAPPTIARVDDALIEQIIAREQERRQARRPKATTNGAYLPSTNGTYPPLSIPNLARTLEQLLPERWSSYDDWLHIGMALHHWAGSDEHRTATAYALFDQYSQERAPDVYGEVAEKWSSFGKRNGDARPVTVGTLIEWAKADRAQDDESPIEGLPDTPEPPHPATMASPEATRREAQCTDLANARRLVAQHGTDLRYVREWGWLIWDGRRWALDATSEIERRAKETARSIYQEAADAPEHLKKDLARHAIASQSHGRLASLIALAESEIEVRLTSDAFDANDWLLTCANGTLDLRTGVLRQHDRGDMLTKAIDVAYDPQAPCPQFLAFLDRIFAGNEALISYVQRMIGYMLTGSTGAQCMFIAYGTGANGKSVLTDVIRALLGEYARNADSSTFMAQQTDRIRSDIARLAGVRFVSTVELDDGRRLSEALVKQIAGGDVLTARFLNKNEFEFKPRFKLLLATNHKPIIRGTDYAIWRRIRLIPFTVTIPEAERDPDLADKICQELSGILAWAVRGCLDWQRTGLQEPDKVKVATNAYRSEMDVIGQFLDEQCTVGPHARVMCKALYAAYEQWCKNGGEQPVNQRSFGAQMTERGFDRVRGTGGVWHYTGIGLLSDRTEPDGNPPAGVEAEINSASDVSDVSDVNSRIFSREDFTKERSGNLGNLRHLDHSVPDPLTRLDWPYVESRYRAGDTQALHTHCAMRRVPFDEVIAEARRRWPELAEVPAGLTQ